MKIAIDPGNIKSGYVEMTNNYMITYKGKLYNDMVLKRIAEVANNQSIAVIIEKAQPFKITPKTLLDTMLWSGRFIQQTAVQGGYTEVYLIPRVTVKKHMTGKGNSSDAMVRQSIIQRFGAPRTRQDQEANPFYMDGELRITADMWQAYALGITYLDSLGIDKCVLMSPEILNKIERVV